MKTTVDQLIWKDHGKSENITSRIFKSVVEITLFSKRNVPH